MIEDKSRQLERVKSQLDDLRREREEDRARHQEALRNVQGHADAQREKAQQRVRALEGELEELWRARDQERHQLTSEVGELRKNIALKEALLSRATGGSHRLDEALRQLATLTRRIEECQQSDTATTASMDCQNAQLRKDKLDLEMRLADETARHTMAMEAAQRDHSAAMEALRQQMDDEKSVLQTEEAQRRSTVSASLVEAQAQITVVQQQLDAMQREKEKAEARLAAEENQRGQQFLLQRDQEQHVRVVESQKKELQERYQDLEQQLAECKSKLYLYVDDLETYRDGAGALNRGLGESSKVQHYLDKLLRGLGDENRRRFAAILDHVPQIDMESEEGEECA